MRDNSPAYFSDLHYHVKTKIAFELVKVRRQLEFTIAASRGIALAKPPSTLAAVGEIVRERGFAGLYNGFRLHFRQFCISFLTTRRYFDIPSF
jgi:hypothetical protein